MEILTQELCRKIISTGIAYAKAKGYEVEISISGSDDGSARFAQNRIIQNTSTEEMELSVRVLIDGKQARKTTDHNVSAPGLKRLIDRAIEIARFQQKDEFVVDLPEPQPIPVIEHFDEATANMTASERGKVVADMVAEARANNMTTAGFYQTSRVVNAIGNSKGLFAFDQASEVECSVTMLAADSSGWAKGDNVRASRIDHLALARKAIQIARDSANPVVVKPGKYTVILEPSAVLDLVTFLWPNFTGTSFIDQDSCFVGKLGKQVLGSNITIWDNVHHPLQWGCPYDGEGMPKSTVKLVENGVLKNLVYGRRSARILNVSPTGHAAAQPSEIDEDPENFVIEGGTTSIEEMIASTDHGLLIPRVWYVRDVDEAVTKLLTGMTRDGLFLIEGGKIVSGVQNLRFNQSLIEMLKNVVAMSPSVLASGEEGLAQVVPAMKVENFEFTAGTSF